MSIPVTLLSSTGDNMSLIGTPYQTQAWYGYGVVVNTVSISVMDLIGTVAVEGSIASSPGEADWAPLYTNTYATATTGTIGQTFEGNWLWIRARLDRSNLPPVVSVAAVYGVVDSVLLDNTSNVVSANNAGGSSGATSAANVGTGAGLFQQSAGGVLNFRSIIGLGGLTVVQNASDVTLSLSGSAGGGIDVQDNSVDVGIAKALNFSGAVVTMAGTTATVTVGAANGGERAHFRYTSGNTGNLTASDALVEKSGNVTVNIVDPVNCIVQFIFANRPNPPSSVAIMGQNYATNSFIFANLNPAISTRGMTFGGTADSPSIFGGFTSMTIQLRMADTGASAGFGNRAHAAVVFNF